MSEDAMASAPAEAARLIVWSEDPEGAAPLLKVLKQRFVLTEQPTLPEVDEHLDETPNVAVLLLYCSPVVLLCDEMAEGKAPSLALTGWQQRAQELLRLNRRNRRQIRLIETGEALQHMHAFARHFEISGLAETVKSPAGHKDEILVLMAQRMLEGDLHTRRLLDELSAASLDLSGGAKQPTDDPDAAFRAYRHTQTELDGLQQQSRSIQKELDTEKTQREETQKALQHATEIGQKRHQELEYLRIQTQATQAELDTAKKQSAALQTQLKTEERRGQKESEHLRQKLQASQDALAAEETHNGELTLALESTKKSLLQAHQEVELLQARNKAGQMETEKLVARQAELQVELRNAMAESQKTRQSLEDLLMQNQALQQEKETLAADCDRLQQRLTQVNQGMESFESQVALLSTERQVFIKRLAEKERNLEAAGGSLQEQQLRLEHLARELGKMRQEREATLQHAENLQQKIKEKEQVIIMQDAEIQHILTSKSFRLTAPLRKLRALFLGRG